MKLNLNVFSKTEKFIGALIIVLASVVLFHSFRTSPATAFIWLIIWVLCFFIGFAGGKIFNWIKTDDH